MANSKQEFGTIQNPDDHDPKKRVSKVPKKRATKFKQGFYTIQNLEKYVGDPRKCVFRSSWELSMNQFLDRNPNILRWSSEEVIIPYVKPTDGKVHRYFPDYWVEYRTREGTIIQEILEVKPDTQVNPRKKKRLTKYDEITYAINIAKWQAATEFCKQRGIKFRILTENEMFR